MAQKFAREGCKVTVWDINQQGLDQLAADFNKEGFTLVTDLVDLTKRTAIEEAGKRLLEKVGRVDILVNNAGIVSGKPLLECAPELVQRTMDVNINAHFWTCRSFLPGMIDRKHGHVVTVASMAGHVGVPRMTDYAASKFAAVGFDESLRVEMKKMKTGIKTTCVCPYYISTGMFEGVKSRFSFLFPIMTPEYVASQILSAVKRNDEVLMLPWSMVLLPWARLFPIPVQDFLIDLLGIHSSMDQFIGRGAPPKNKKQD